MSLSQGKLQIKEEKCNQQSKFIYHTRSYKNVKKLLLNNLSSIKDSGVTTTGNSTTNKSGLTKFQSAIDIKNNDSTKNVLRESSSLKPFPKIDPEFYTEKKNYFWQREMTKIRSEKSIFSQKTDLKKQLSQKNNKMFYEVIYT